MSEKTISGSVVSGAMHRGDNGGYPATGTTQAGDSSGCQDSGNHRSVDRFNTLNSHRRVSSVVLVRNRRPRIPSGYPVAGCIEQNGSGGLVIGGDFVPTVYGCKTITSGHRVVSSLSTVTGIAVSHCEDSSTLRSTSHRSFSLGHYSSTALTV